MLTAAHLLAGQLAQDTPAEQSDTVQQLRTILYGIESELRDLSHDLRPRVLDDFGIGPALTELGRSFSRRTGIETRVESVIRSRLLSATETACYRVAEEALTNIRKHSKATRAFIHLRQSGARVVLSIRDNGVGFRQRGSQASPSTGLGLAGMTERADALGGRILITSRPGRGTEVVLSIPIHRTNSGENPGTS
jgi:two-component system NarL family sensor kinase